ncbi:MAG: N-acetylglucosamine-6-phosphate [Erysipelotrichaceae bacterium]|nr:MAG: N-acetylglucosamine-6-phosphate [Erysipelotrichaceae bacterium]
MNIKSDRILTEKGFINGWIEEKDGVITHIGQGLCPSSIDVDATGQIVCPGLIDIHLHGYNGWLSSSSDIKHEDVIGFLHEMARQGVTACMPSVEPKFYPVLAKAYKEQSGSRLLGIYLEAYFTTKEYSGFRGERGIFPLPTVEYAKELLETSDNLLKYVMIAPELPHAAETMRFLKERGVKIAAGHTLMKRDEFLKFTQEGLIDSLCHTANNMGQMHQRDVGVMGVGLLDPNITCELICDFLHVSQEMIEIILRIKEHDKIVLISDSTFLSGKQPGEYPFEDKVLIVTEEYQIVDKAGNIHGSCFPLIHNLGLLVKKNMLSIEEAVKMATLNPAKFMGVDDEIGSLKEGKAFDVIIIDDDFKLISTYVKGQKYA